MFAFIVAFIVSYLVAEIFYKLRKDTAIELGEKLDGGRKCLIKIICSTISKPYGIFRAIILIFLINLVGGVLLWSSVGGVFIIFPFLHYIVTGFLLNLILKRYPERKHWLVIPNFIFEVGAFMVAASGGVYMGFHLFGGGDFPLAFYQWGLLFTTLTVPLQFIAAVFEAFLFQRIYVVDKQS